MAAAKAFPAVVLTGPRRAGKTWLLRHLFPSAGYHLFEDPDVVARFRHDPQGFLDGVRPPVILQDELFLLRSRTAKLIKDYAEAYEQMSNDTAKKLLDEYMTIEALGLKLRQAYLPKFRAVLPEVKVVRYYQIENKIHAALAYEIGAKIPLVKAAK